jgi:hypothetical protein
VSEWTFLYVYIVAAVAFLLVRFLLERRRDAALRDLAIRRGFTYLGDALPRSLTLHGTALGGATSIWNVIAADRGAIRLVSFDCRIGSGKGSWRRTGLAAQGPRDLFGVPRFTSHLTVERSGDWNIMYEPKTLTPFSSGLMPISEIEAHLDSIGR